MPYSRQTLTQLRDQVASDIDSAVPGVDARLRYSNLKIMGDVQAALANGLYGYQDWIALQCAPFTATGEFLEAWAALKGVIRKPATAAANGIATFAASDGASVLSGALVTRADGASFVSTADATAAGGVIAVPISAQTAGSAGNSLVGVSMTLGVPVAGIQSTGSVTIALTGGADIETDDDLRTRMLLVYAQPAQGGNDDDYRNWALAVPGVTRAWTARPVALGTVSVYFMMDDVRSAEGGFPQGTNGVAAAETRDVAATGDQLLVANAIFSFQPVTPIVYAIAPGQNSVDLTIAGISGATATVKGQISAALGAALQVNASPGGTTDAILLEAAIAKVSGAAGAVLTAIAASNGTVTPGSAGNIVANTGYLSTLGTITYV